MQMPDADKAMDTWATAAERVGVPAATLFGLVIIGSLFLLAVLMFLKPFVRTWFEKQFKLFDTMTDRVNELPAMAKADNEGHQKTHGGLRALKESHDDHHALTKEIHRKVVGPQP